MRQLACLFAVLSACAVANAGEWSYHTTVDSFDGVRISRATLRGSPGFTSLVYEERSDGTVLLAVAGKDYLCFPTCDVKVKFDQNAPINFGANAPRMISSAVFFNNPIRIKPMVEAARTIVVRIQMHREWRDLEFSPDSPLDTTKFAAATARQDKSKRCEQNAVVEDYQTCMLRE